MIHNAQKTLFVLPTLKTSGIANQTKALVEELSITQHDCRIETLDSQKPWPWMKIRHLKEVIKDYQPDVIHAWTLQAMRIVSLCGYQGRFVVSPNLNGMEYRSWWKFIDQWLMKRVDHFITWSQIERERCLALGMDSNKVTTVLPGRQVAPELGNAERITDIPNDKKVILTVGPLEKYKGIQEALWAFHLLLYPESDIHFVIVGEGSDRARLEQYVRDLRIENAVSFVGYQDNLADWFARAEMVWSTGRRDTGTQVVIEAMLAGKPVIAYHWPRLRECIRDGETGLLIAPDVAQLCRAGYRLLTDTELCEQLGRQARAYACEHFLLQNSLSAVAA